MFTLTSFILIGAFILSLYLTGLLRGYALDASMMDIPNSRSSHSSPTPRGGGAAMVAAFALGLVLFSWADLVRLQLVLLLIPCIMTAAVGWLDDRGSVPATARLAVHLLAAGAGIYLLESLPSLPVFGWESGTGPWWGLIVLAGLVWMVNLTNFMDGIDGLASMESICVAGGACLILWLNDGNPGSMRALLLLAAVTAGFFCWNWPPAKIFMGDAGSGFLGMALGLLALETSAQGVVNLWTWIILYGVFIVDATFTLLRRIVRRDRFFEAHRSHAYQILARRFQSHRNVTAGVFLINICWLFPLAVVSSRYPAYGTALAAAALFPLVLLTAATGAGKTNE